MFRLFEAYSAEALAQDTRGTGICRPSCPEVVVQLMIYWKAKLILILLLQYGLELSVKRVFLLADKLYQLEIVQYVC